MRGCQFRPQGQYLTRLYIYRIENCPLLWLHVPKYIIDRPSAALNTENKNISISAITHADTLNLLMIVETICWIDSCYFLYIYICNIFLIQDVNNSNSFYELFQIYSICESTKPSSPVWKSWMVQIYIVLSKYQEMPRDPTSTVYLSWWNELTNWPLGGVAVILN